MNTYILTYIHTYTYIHTCHTYVSYILACIHTYMHLPFEQPISSNGCNRFKLPISINGNEWGRSSVVSSTAVCIRPQTTLKCQLHTCSNCPTVLNLPSESSSIKMKCSRLEPISD